MLRARSSISSRHGALSEHAARGRGLPCRNDFTTPTKENKVKPTEHTAKAAVTPKTGLFATLRALLHAQGSSAFALSLVAAPLAALYVLLALSAGVAQAEPPKLVSYGSFSAHELSAVGVAVEASGDLFVSGLIVVKNGGELEPSTVVKLDPSGNLLSPPSPFGSAYYSGVAVNRMNGDVYVLGQEGLFTTPVTTKIFVYDPHTGALLSSFEVPASLNFSGVLTDVQIAADSAGNVYVPVAPENKVLEYSPSGKLEKTFTGSGAGALKEPTGVAIGSSGNLWVADFGNNRIVELDSNGAPVEVNGKPVEIKSEGAWSVALDGHGDVFALVENSADLCGEKASPCLHLIEYSPEGRQLADVGASRFGKSEGADRFNSMVAVNEASGRVYVTDGGNETVWVFGPPVAPVVDKEFTAEVGASEAKLGALVNPGGIQTSYRFEYGPTGAYGSSRPFPEGSVGEGVESHAVWASASSLAPGTTYHYRVVATNELGTAYGPDQTFTTLSAEEAACSNEQVRVGFSARLPDCRAYELLTPPPKNSSQFDAFVGQAYSSTVAADGEALTLVTTEPQPGAPTSGERYVARRGVGGWIAEDIMPLESYDGVGCPERQPAYAYSDQLTKDVMQVGVSSSASGKVPGGQESVESCNPEGRQVVSGEPVGYENLLVRDNATGTYQLVNLTPPGVTPAGARFQAASADLSHVIFTETSPLAEGARYGIENLYEWDEGAVRLVSVLPDGTAVAGSLAAKADTPEHESVVSSDGLHVLFTYGGALYDRIAGQHTVQIDEQQGGSGPSGGGSFKAATADGSKVFFLDESKLTAGSTAAVGEPDLYECALPAGASKCELSDLTVAAAGEHADVLRVTPLGAHDSSDVYFVAEGVLASNTREFTNGEGKTVVEGAEAGKQNLYLWNGEKTTFIVTGVSYNYWYGYGEGQTSPDGKWLLFESEKSLTGYDNAAAELFLYSAATGRFVCASCNPTGEPGGGVAPYLGNGEALRLGVFRSRQLLTDAGQVFFESGEALVPADTNGQLDVYEYEGGRVYLISSGTSSFESNLEGASESGNDVFFRSNQALVPQDTREGMIVMYDARVAGGFAESSSPPACTTADACRTPVSPQPAIYGAPSSQTFSGVGNLAPSEVKPKAKLKAKPVKCKGDGSRRGKKKGKCVRKPKKKVRQSAHTNKAGK
jgi:DNA-binding beta-propeller fold protein YncE